MKIPTILDSDVGKHKPTLQSRIFWRYGYINSLEVEYPVARKNRITGNVYFKSYSRLDGYYWGRVTSKYAIKFISKKYW
jgi:hypothetical protein